MFALQNHHAVAGAISPRNRDNNSINKYALKNQEVDWPLKLWYIKKIRISCESTSKKVNPFLFVLKSFTRKVGNIIRINYRKKRNF